MPKSKSELLQTLADSLIDRGVFFEALSSNKALKTSDTILKVQVLVKNLSTNDKTFGVFIGIVVLEDDLFLRYYPDCE